MKSTSRLHHRLLAGGLLGIFLTAGCSSLEPSGTPGGPPAGQVETPSALSTRFANVPIPPGFDLDRSKSFIYESGSGTVKVGKLFLTGWNDADEVIEYFRNEMVTKGWSSISIMEQKATIMVYEQETQVCTIMVEPSFGKTQVQINVGPK